MGKLRHIGRKQVTFGSKNQSMRKISGVGKGMVGEAFLTYAALSIHLHWVQNWMVRRGRTGSTLGVSLIVSEMGCGRWPLVNICKIREI